jgi:hypothetical protein
MLDPPPLKKILLYTPGLLPITHVPVDKFEWINKNTSTKWK